MQASPPQSAMPPDMSPPDVSPDTIGVCIEGKPSHVTTPTEEAPPAATPTKETPPPATPTLPKAPAVEKEATLSSAELDERIQLHLEARAIEWSVQNGCGYGAGGK